MSRRDPVPPRPTGMALWLDGEPHGVAEAELALLRSRVQHAVSDLVRVADPPPFTLRVGYGEPPTNSEEEQREPVKEFTASKMDR